MSLHPAIFLDRDGVIIENRPDYVRSWADVDIYPQALKALTKVRSTPYKIIVVTNQSVVGRGMISLTTARRINKRLVDVIERAGGRVDAVFMCPHAPHDNCQCRKPKPGLLLQAARAHALGLSRSIMIGDALTDMMAGQRAKVNQLALLRTGRGASQLTLPEATHFRHVPVYDTLLAALADLLGL